MKGTCWYCTYGWPSAIVELAERYRHLGDDLKFGPGHIVWADENFDDDSIRFCLNECATNRGQYELDNATIDAIAKSLEELLLIPESVRCPIGSDEDDPELFPPPSGLALTIPKTY